MKPYKVVLITREDETSMNVDGTIYFDTEHEARAFVKATNEANNVPIIEVNVQRAKYVIVSPTYTVVDN
jgi:hypothetical protein